MEEEKIVEELKKERSSLEHFLSLCGHEIRNRLSPVPGFATTSLFDVLQLGANFDKQLYGQYLAELEREEGLSLPPGLEIPKKISYLELKTATGEEIKTIEDFAATWLGSLTESLLRIYHSAQRTQDLVESLLDLNRIRSGRYKYDMQRLDIAKVISETINDYQQQSKKKGLYLEVETEKNLPLARADLSATRQILTNLVRNAVKYTEKGGIRIKARKNENGMIEIAVEDTGCGIPKEEASKVFEPFGRTSKTAHVEGSGIGMVITQAYVKDHDGKIWFESEEDKGTTFFVTLPQAVKSKVNFVKNKKTGNLFFVYDQNLEGEIEDFPKDFIVGVANSCLTDLINPLTVPTSTYLQLDEKQKKDLTTIRERLLKPTGKIVEKRILEIKEKYIDGKLYFLDADLKKLTSKILRMREGISREELDRALKAEILNFPPIGREMSRGKNGFFQTIAQAEKNYNPIYRYNMQEDTATMIENTDVDKGVVYVLDDLLVTLRDPRNYADIHTFEKNISQKVLAFVYSNRVSQKEEFAATAEKEKEPAIEQALYDLIEKEFIEIERKK